MWPFKRKKPYPPKAEIQIADAWQTCQGTYNEQVIFTRFNRCFDAIAGHPEYTYQCGITIPLKHPLPTGLPDPEEGAELWAIETELARVLEAGNETLLVGVITTGGKREFVFYTSDPERVRVQVAVLQESIETHELQLTIQPDEQWSVYRQFANEIEAFEKRR